MALMTNKTKKKQEILLKP